MFYVQFPMLIGPLVIVIPIIHLRYDKMVFYVVILKPTIECDKGGYKRVR